jgi:hypothetical protein
VKYIAGIALCVGIAVVASFGTTAIAQAPSVRLEDGAFRVSGWTPPPMPPPGGWASILVVRTGDDTAPALLGTYTIYKRELVFRPRFPISPDVRYRVVFHPPGGSVITTTIAAPQRTATPAARVEQVYPSGDVLPANSLRLYIYFSAPMSRGEAAAHLRVLDEAEKPLQGIFLPREELWDPGNRRLTLTFDPGRIKRGLVSNTRMGTPIAEGERYTLVIDREWRDAHDVPLVAEFRKAFRGGPPLRAPPDPRAWPIAPPHAGSSEPLTVTFAQPMNYALLQRMIRVESGAGTIAGSIAVDRAETVWRFTPATAWRAGPYRLVVDGAIEDIAGNRPGLPFDVESVEPPAAAAAPKPIVVPFRIGAGSGE